MALDKRFLPEEIRTIEQLHSLMNAKDFETIAEFLKWARINLAKLDPLRFAIFTKFKANLLKQNVKLSDNDLLTKSVSEIANMLREQLGIKTEVNNAVSNVEISDSNNDEKVEEAVLNENSSDVVDDKFGGEVPKNEEEMIKEIVTADVSLIEDERQEFRKSLLGEEYKCVIKRGNALQIKMNKKGTRIEIVIPSVWDIEIEDALLLDLYDKRFSRFELPKNKGNMEESQRQVKGKENHSEETKVEPTMNKEPKSEEAQTELIQSHTEHQTKEQLSNEEQKIEEKKVEIKESDESQTQLSFYDYIETLLFDESLDFYKTRSKVISYIRKHGKPEEFSSISGGEAKVASEIIIHVACKLIKEGKLDISKLEGRFSKRVISKIESMCGK